MKKTVFLLLTALFLFGCSTSDKQGEDNTAHEAELIPDYGGTLKIYSYNSDTFNPLFTKNKANMQMLNLIFDHLIVCDERQMPTPVLAEGFSVSEDGLVWRLDIKRGITWHDGTPFSAKDVAATLEAVRSSSQNSIYKENLYNVASISEDGNTVIITLKQPQTNFVNLLEIPIVKKESANAYSNFDIIGTGRYVISSKNNKVINLTASNSWHGGNAPYITNIEVLLLPDKATSVYAFEAREIHAVTTDLLNWGKFSSSSNGRTFEYATNDFVFLSFNKSNEFLSRVEIRRAFAHAINKEKIFDEALLSHGLITNTFASPKWWVYDDSAALYPYDPTKAANMIDALDINPNDIKVSILFNDDNNIKVKVAEIIAENLKEIGINAVAEPVSWEIFIQRVEKGDYDLYLGEIRYSPEINPKYVLDLDDETQEMINLLQNQTTDEGRKQLYSSLQRHYAENLPSIPLYFEVEALLLNSKIKGDAKPLAGHMFSNIHKWFIETVNN